MNRVLKVGAMSLCFATGASAQGTDLSISGSQIEGLREFSFSASGASDYVRQEQFCLPRDQVLLRIKEVVSSQSNDRSRINVWADVQSNCVRVTVSMPPQKSACVKVPQFSGLTLKYVERCTYVPTMIAFAVKYEAQKVPQAALDNFSAEVPANPVEDQPKL